MRLGMVFLAPVHCSDPNAEVGAQSSLVRSVLDLFLASFIF